MLIPGCCSIKENSACFQLNYYIFQALICRDLLLITWANVSAYPLRFSTGLPRIEWRNIDLFSLKLDFFEMKLIYPRYRNLIHLKSSWTFNERLHHTPLTDDSTGSQPRFRHPCKRVQPVLVNQSSLQFWIPCTSCDTIIIWIWRLECIAQSRTTE